VSDLPPKSSIVPRLRSATESVAADVDDQYRSRLCQLVEREMNRRFRRQEDPEDVVQSAFRTFYRRNAQGEFHIDSSGDVWRLLETIARRKLIKHIAKQGAKKRDVHREEYAWGDSLPGQVPTPEEAAIAADLIEKALAGLDERHVAAFNLRLQSHTEEEIASALTCTRTLVRRMLNRIRARLEKLCPPSPPEGNRQPAELAELLRRCLESPVNRYLGIETPPGPAGHSWADAPSKEAAASMPLGELLRIADPPLGLLIGVKRRARRMMKAGVSHLPVEVERCLYLGSIAAALVRLGVRISKSEPDVSRTAFEQAAAQEWIEGGLRGLLGDALRLLSDTS
jgi:RNA polymerase sigma-70 factor, ECF subfamily